MEEIKTGKAVMAQMMAGLFKAIQERGFQEPETEKDPWAWIPERYRGASFENYYTDGTDEKACVLRTVREQIKHISQIWAGNYGTGKTHLAYACVKAYGAKYRSFSGILSQIKDDWDGEEYIIRDYIKPRILILDEIGTLELSEWRMDILFRIVDGRYAARKPTTLITNKSPEEIIGYLGNRICDRLDATMLMFDWQSERRRYK